jgi:tetratricopeptide (TPR) repeat protein
MVEGTAVRVSTTLTIPFVIEGPRPSPEQEKSAQAAFPLSDKCRSALKDHQVSEALDYCKQALDMCIKAGEVTSSDQLMMTNSLEEYGQALLLSERFEEAFDQENKAVEKAKIYRKPTDEELAWPFYWRARVEESLGNYEAALADFSVAEETHRRAIANLPEMKQMYSRYLATILRQHADLLEQMGKISEASKLRDEASTL